MKKSSCSRLLLAAALGLAACHKPAAHAPVIRVAVIGGMTMTGLWPRLAAQFEADTGLRVELVATGPKDVLTPVFRAGKVDLLTMHSSDQATNLVADGYATNLRPWARNEQVIMGPPGDPAGIRGLRDGAAALRKIAATHSPFIDAQGGGKRLVSELLWEKAGIRPVGDWVLKDESPSSSELLHFAESRGAYAICGRIPVLAGKIPRGHMEIMVQGDPDMQRPFIVIEAAPHRFPSANIAGARRLADYLVSDRGQDFLRRFAQEQPAGVPLFYPLK
jgi:tungstate transport system substrate-binding protein